MLQKTYQTYKHQSRTNPNHDQSEHGNWAEGRGGTRDGVFPTGGGGGGGIQGMAQQFTAASKKPSKWQMPVSSAFFDGITKKNWTEIDARAKKVIAQRQKSRFNPNWDLRRFMTKRASAGVSGVQEIQVAPGAENQPNIPTIPNKSFFLRRTPLASPGMTYDKNTWLAYDGYIMPLVTDTVSAALGMQGAPARSHIDSIKSVISSAIKGFRIDTSNQKMMDDINSNVINVEEQALLDLIIGQGDGHMNNYMVVRTSDGYALRGFDEDLSGQARITDKGEKNVSVSSFPLDTMIKNGMNGSKVQRFVNRDNVNAVGDIKIRFSPEMMQRLAVAQFNLQWDPNVPEGVREQIQSRIQYILGKAAHDNEPVSFVELNTLSKSQKENPSTIGLRRLDDIRQNVRGMAEYVSREPFRFAFNGSLKGESTYNNIYTSEAINALRQASAILQPQLADISIAWHALLQNNEFAPAPNRPIGYSPEQMPMQPLNQQQIDFARQIITRNARFNLGSFNTAYETAFESSKMVMALINMKANLRKIQSQHNPNDKLFNQAITEIETYMQQSQDFIKRSSQNIANLPNFVGNPNSDIYMYQASLDKDAQSFIQLYNAVQMFEKKYMSRLYRQYQLGRLELNPPPDPNRQETLLM